MVFKYTHLHSFQHFIVIQTHMHKAGLREMGSLLQECSIVLFRKKAEFYLWTVMCNHACHLQCSQIVLYYHNVLLSCFINLTHCFDCCHFKDYWHSCSFCSSTGRAEDMCVNHTPGCHMMQTDGRLKTVCLALLSYQVSSVSKNIYGSVSKKVKEILWNSRSLQKSSC